MARITRSSQREMERTQSNLNPLVPSFQSTLPAVPPAPEFRHVLGELPHPNEQAASAQPKNPVDVELKGLKAAFRSAIGIKKKKKSKKSKTSGTEDIDAQTLTDGESVQENNGVSQSPGDTTQQKLIVSNSAAVVNPPSDTVRTTRRQLAAQDSGQSESTISSLDGSGYYPGAFQHPPARSYSQQIVNNIRDGQYEIFRTLEMANHSIILADGVRRELEGLMKIPAVKARLQKQPPIQSSDDIFVERDVKMLSPIDDKTPTLEVAKAEIQKPIVKMVEILEIAKIEVENPSEKAIESDDDSFVQAITSRSPAKPVSRVDDYVDELDKLEDVIEALDEATSPNPKATAPSKTAFLSGKHGSSLETEQVSRIFSPTDVELAKLRNGQAYDNNTTTATKPEGYRSLRVKTKDGSLQSGLAPVSSLRKVKSTQFGTNARKVSNHSTRTLSGSSSREVMSKRPVTAPATTQVTRGISRAASRSETRRPVITSTKQAVKSTRPITSSTIQRPGKVMAQKVKEQRETRRSQLESEDTDSRAGSVIPKIRSAKPPTKPAFELPGEAISRRKREAHEARLKKQEAEERKRREFKARPTRTSFVPSAAVRETAASRARQSLIAQSHAIHNTADSSKQIENLHITKRGSTTTTGNTRPVLLSADSNPSISNARPPAAAMTHRNLTPHASIVGTARPAPITKPTTSMTGLSTQRSTSIRKVSDSKKGKEIYQRQEKQLADMQREKKEKEEVARRVREEAAERGRQASREWAEKQKERERARAGKGDVGLGPGFGPGGQLGLKA